MPYASKKQFLISAAAGQPHTSKIMPDSFWHQRYERWDLLPQSNGLSHCGNANHPKSETPGKSQDWLLWINIYWCHWDNTNFLNSTKKLKTTHTECNICHRFCVSCFWCKAGTFFVFPNMGCSFCRPPHCVFMRLPCSLLLHLFCIRRDLASTQLSGREGKAYWCMKEVENNMYFKKKRMENIWTKVPKGKLKQALFCRRQNTLQMWSPSSFCAMINNFSSCASEQYFFFKENNLVLTVAPKLKMGKYN